MKKIILSVIITVLAQYAAVGYAEENTADISQFGTGLAEMSEERWADFEANLPMITDIKPNEIALSRLAAPSVQAFSAADQNDVESAEIGSEFSCVYPNQSSGGSVAPSEFPLASAVDVSSSLTFPPIGNQGDINSCVAWSLCYYQLTNNNCVIEGKESKTSSGAAVQSNIMSPRFIYPLINGGENVATYYDEACAAIMSYGCPDMAEYPGAITKNNLSAWCVDTSVWNNAMYNKPNKIMFEYCSESSGTITSDTPFVENIKKILSDGYVVTIPTYVNSFVYTNQTTDGNYGCRYVSSTKRGGHAMTIVGYDDNYWIDVNGNNQPDSGETGAFKIANSWGTTSYYFKDGYIYMPYDAIGLSSGVANAPTARCPAFDRYYFIMPQKDYKPLLTAEVEMSTQNRNQIAVNVGISDINKTTTDYLINVGNDYHIAFNDFSRSWLADDIYLLHRSFSGALSEQTATIPFDLTPVIKKAYDSTGFTEKTQKRLYVEVKDAVVDSYDLTFGNLTIKEPITGKSADCTNQTAVTTSIRNNSVMKTVDFEITPFVGFSGNQPITLVFSSNVQAESAANQIFLTKDNNTYYPNCEVSGNRITISPPQNGYICDTDYELHISPGIKSVGGNSLPAEKTVMIYMLGEYYIFG